LRDPLARDLGWQRFERDRLRLQIVSQLVERGVERRDHRRLSPRAYGFIALSELRKVLRQPLGGRRAAPGLSSSRLLQSIDRGLERGDVVGIRRRFLVRVRPQYRIEYARQLADGGKLGLLVVGNEILDGLYARHLGQLGELLHVGFGGLLVRRQHEDRACTDGGIASQLQEGRDGFDVGAAQVERIEIELEPVEQRQSGGDCEASADDDGDSVPLHESIDRRQALEPHFLRLARRPQDGQQRRNERDAGEKGDDHAQTCEQAELGEAFVVGRKERQKPGSGCRRG
jgi:hypothetical protein